MLTPKPRGLIGELSQSRERIFQDHLAGQPAVTVVRRATDWMEGVIKRLYGEALSRYPVYAPVGLAAVGGFGRGELNLFSDVDLLFLYPTKIKGEMEKLAELVLYPLWDLKLEVSHAARTLPECLEMAGEDFSILVTMLTARTVAGSAEPALELAQGLAKSLAGLKARRGFLEKVQAEDQKRQARYGHTPYLLEPNLKEGEGGLRDIHTITWLGLGCFKARRLAQLQEQGLMTDGELAFLGTAKEELWRIRNHLHYLSQAHDDRLTFERQAQVAGFLGFKDQDGLGAVVRFMRDYYTRAHHIRNIRDIVYERARTKLELGSKRTRPVDKDLYVRGDKLYLSRPERLKEEPALMMALFAGSAKTGVKVSHQARQEVRGSRYLVDDAFRRDPGVRSDFYTVLNPPRPEGGAIFALHGSGLLGAYLPEFEDIFQLPHNDAFHIYTVDVHLLRTVDRLSRLAGGHEPASEGERLTLELLKELSRPRLLHLAALLHDLGKGGGKSHAERGAKIAGTVLERLGLKEEERDLVLFLIRNHLLLIETASRRDIHDEKILFSVARQVGDQERLAMLYLLTVADAHATGPNAWSTWQATLLNELYFRVLATLTRSDIDYLGSPQWQAELTEAVAGRLAGVIDREKVVAHLDALPDQYLLAASPEKIAHHLRLMERLSGRQMVFEVEELKGEGYCQFTVAGRRRRGLFSRMAGVLTLNGLNILGAQIHTRSDNISLVLFQTEFPVDPYDRDRRWAKVEADMARALSGRLALGVRLAQRLGQTKAYPRFFPRQPVSVKVDNSISDFHSVIEVTAHDRLGLLYDITRVFYDLDLEIRLAKISTKVDQVLDVFYVTDLEGGKVEDEEQLKEIEESLQAILSQVKGATL